MATPELSRDQEFSRLDIVVPLIPEVSRSHLRVVPDPVEVSQPGDQLRLFAPQRQPVDRETYEPPTSRLEFLLESMQGFREHNDPDHPEHHSLGSLMMHGTTALQIAYIEHQ